MLPDSHTVASAMELNELTEEEAYFVLRFAGHLGYEKAMRRLQPGGILHRIRRWLVWFGGWETPELCQWDKGWPAWQFHYRHDGGRKSPTPVSLFGHRLTFHDGWWQLKLPKGTLTGDTKPWRSDEQRCVKHRMYYRSYDGGVHVVFE